MTGWWAPPSRPFSTVPLGPESCTTYMATPLCISSSGMPDVSQCLLPIMEVNSWLTGRRGVSLPFTDDCDPVCPDPAAFRGLFEEALRHAEARDWKYLECRGGKALWPGATASTCYYGHRLGLVDNEEVLFANVDSAVRRAIRKGHKSGVIVEISQDLGCRTRVLWPAMQDAKEARPSAPAVSILPEHPPAHPVP